MSKLRLGTRERNALGRRLKLAREAADLSQAEAAKRLALRNPTTLANWEQGRAEIPLTVLTAVSRLYTVKLEELVLGAPAPPEAVDLETRRKYVRIHQLTRELLVDLVELVHRLEVLHRGFGLTPPNHSPFTQHKRRSNG